MTPFIVLAVLIVGFSVGIFAKPLWLKLFVPKKSPQANEVAIGILKDELQLLERKLSIGQIALDAYNENKSTLQQKIKEATQLVPPKVARSKEGHIAKWQVILAATVPILSIALYLIFINPSLLNPNVSPQQGNLQGNSQTAPPTSAPSKKLEGIVSEIKAKLKKEPDDAPAWILLGKHYAAMDRFDEARDSFKRALSLDAKNDELLADLADMTAFQNKSINAEAIQYINAAIVINPLNIKALALKGSAAFENKDYTQAIQHWTVALGAVKPNDVQFAENLKSNIREARGLSQEISPLGSANSGKTK